MPLIAFIIPHNPVSFEKLHAQPLDVDTLLFASSNAFVQFSPMLIIPVLVPLLTQLLGTSQDLLPWLFFVGGGTGYLPTKITGVLTCRFSVLILATGSTLIFILGLLIPFPGYQHPALFITLFLGASYSRLVSSSAVTVQFPDDRHQAGFSSFQISIMYLITTFAFFLSAVLLPNHGIIPGRSPEARRRRRNNARNVTTPGAGNAQCHYPSALFMADAAGIPDTAVQLPLSGKLGQPG